MQKITCDGCDAVEYVDAEDLSALDDRRLARRANWAVTGTDILCPLCFDALNPIS